MSKNPEPRNARRLLSASAVCVAAALSSPTALAAKDCCPIVELRQYTMYPGKRDTLISLFEERFIETQEAVGIRVLGQFRDLNDANKFVWVRGFDDMERRQKALTDFYYGPVWKANRDQANATLYDNDDVLLLHPASPGSGFAADGGARPSLGAPTPGGRFIVGTIYYFGHEADKAFVAKFDNELMPLFERSGARILGRYVSDKSKNTFERLPVREADNVFVWFASFDDRNAYERYIAELARDARWRDILFGELRKSLLRPPETLMLQPTARSLVR